jgi:hypothetical protein
VWRAKILSPRPLWGRGWRDTGVVISRGATGEGVNNRANAENDDVEPHTAVRQDPLREPQRGAPAKSARVSPHSQLRRKAPAHLGGAGVICRQDARLGLGTARGIWEVKRVEFLTPSPVPHPLMKTRDAVHPLPQGGEGGELHNSWSLFSPKSAGAKRRWPDPLTRLAPADESAGRKPPLPQGGEGGSARRHATQCRNSRASISD